MPSHRRRPGERRDDGGMGAERMLVRSCPRALRETRARTAARPGLLCIGGPSWALVGPTLFRYGFAFSIGLTLLPIPAMLFFGLLHLLGVAT